MAEELKIGLDPNSALEAMKKLQEAAKALSEIIDKSLGKEAPKAIDTLDKAAERGADSISSRFKDLSKRIGEDLKTAFNVGQLASGLKLADYLGQGVKEVFNLERAFDKLNTRLQLTGRNFQDFKNNVGKSVASTGQKLEDIFPGIETAASKGGVKSPKELADIGQALAKVRAATGENTESLADSVVEILKTQNKKITSRSIQDTLDVLQGTRVAGAFKSAADAGKAIEGLSPYAKQLGLSTRDLGGLASSATGAGSAGQDILQRLIQQATQIGGASVLNSALGQNIFKAGSQGQAVGMDVNALRKVNPERFGSAQAMEQITGLTGASGGDFKRFITSLKESTQDFDKVTHGSNETAKQFELASDNLATSADKYTQSLVNATRSVGDGLSSAVHDFMKGDTQGGLDELKKAGKSAWDNKATIAGGLGISLAAGVLTGGGLGGVLKSFGGVGGTATGVAEGKALEKAAGVTPVFVVNAAEIGAASSTEGLLSKAGGFASKLGIVGAVGGAGVAAGSALADSDIGQKVRDSGIFDSLIDLIDGSKKRAQSGLDEANDKFKSKTGIAHDDYEKLGQTIGKHVGGAINNPNKPTVMINPSSPTGGAPRQ